MHLQRHGALGECGPSLDEEQDAQYWLDSTRCAETGVSQRETTGPDRRLSNAVGFWCAQMLTLLTQKAQIRIDVVAPQRGYME